MLQIRSAGQVRRFTRMCGAKIPPRLETLLAKVEDDDEAATQVGIDYATEQARDSAAVAGASVRSGAGRPPPARRRHEGRAPPADAPRHERGHGERPVDASARRRGGGGRRASEDSMAENDPGLGVSHRALGISRPGRSVRDLTTAARGWCSALPSRPPRGPSAPPASPPERCASVARRASGGRRALR